MPDDLTLNYQRAGFSGRLSFGSKTALLVIDVVQAYLRKDSPLYAGVEDALASTLRLIEAARTADAPIVYTRVVYQAGGLDGGLFYLKVPALKLFDAGSPFGAFCDGIAPRPSEIVITKQYPSAFFGTTLAPTLRTMGVDTLLLCGFSTSGCVRSSAIDALQNGFAPFIVRQACGDRDQRVQNANLFDLQAKYAEVIDEFQATAQLTSSTYSL